MNRLLINAIFPGEPIAWERVGGHGSRIYKPKETRQAQSKLRRQLKCIAPNLQPDRRSRFGVQLVFFARNSKDGDNCEKLLLDAFNKTLWWDDRQVKECQWKMIDPAEVQQIHFICYVIE